MVCQGRGTEDFIPAEFGLHSAVAAARVGTSALKRVGLMSISWQDQLKEEASIVLSLAVLLPYQKGFLHPEQCIQSAYSRLPTPFLCRASRSKWSWLSSFFLSSWCLATARPRTTSPHKPLSIYPVPISLPLPHSFDDALTFSMTVSARREKSYFNLTCCAFVSHSPFGLLGGFLTSSPGDRHRRIRGVSTKSILREQGFRSDRRVQSSVWCGMCYFLESIYVSYIIPY